MKKYWNLLKITFKEWSADDVPRLAASLAYYTAFSLAPLLLVVLALVSFFYGDEAARGQIVAQFSNELGAESAQFIQQMIQESNEGNGGIISTLISVVMLLVGATTVFAQLQGALNEVWDIEVESGGIMMMLQKRVLSFGLIMTLTFLLLISLVINSVIASLDTYLISIMPAFQILGHFITFAVSFGVSTLLFAIIYKYMPDAKIAWRDVIVGAIVTSILFNIGRFALGLYIGNIGVSSSYGAAGSFLVILLWVYYSAQIVMFGAEFTQVYARRYGTRIMPEEGATFNVKRQLAMNDIDMDEIEEELISDVKNKEQDAVDSAMKPIPTQTTPHTPQQVATQIREARAESSGTSVIVDDEARQLENEKRNVAMVIGSFTAVIGAGIGWLLGRNQS